MLELLVLLCLLPATFESTMTKTEFYLLIDEVIEAAPGIIIGDESLSAILTWDSLAVIGFISALDKRLQLSVTARALSEARTVQDLVALASARLVG